MFLSLVIISGVSNAAVDKHTSVVDACAENLTNVINALPLQRSADLGNEGQPNHFGRAAFGTLDKHYK